MNKCCENVFTPFCPTCGLSVDGRWGPLLAYLRKTHKNAAMRIPRCKDRIASETTHEVYKQKQRSYLVKYEATAAKWQSWIDLCEQAAARDRSEAKP